MIYGPSATTAATHVSVNKDQFNSATFHVPNLIPIWVDQNDVRLIVDSDNELNIGLDVGIDVGLHSFSQCAMVYEAH